MFKTTALLFLSLSSAAYANSVDLTHTGRGAFNSAAFAHQGKDWKIMDGNYNIRSIGAGPVNIDISRNYHFFDIPTLQAGETISSATLNVFHPNGNFPSYDSPDTTETFDFYSIETDGSIVNDDAWVSTDPIGYNQQDLITVFNDLGEGDFYGSFTASAASNGTTESTLLNQNALSALTEIGLNGGGEWGIGGSIATNTITTLGVWERAFRGSANQDTFSTLTLEVAAVPVPAAVWLFGSALVGLVGFNRKKHLTC